MGQTRAPVSQLPKLVCASTMPSARVNPNGSTCSRGAHTSGAAHVEELTGAQMPECHAVSGDRVATGQPVPGAMSSPQRRSRLVRDSAAWPRTCIRERTGRAQKERERELWANKQFDSATWSARSTRRLAERHPTTTRRPISRRYPRSTCSCTVTMNGWLHCCSASSKSAQRARSPGTRERAPRFGRCAAVKTRNHVFSEAIMRIPLRSGAVSPRQYPLNIRNR